MGGGLCRRRHASAQPLARRAVSEALLYARAPAYKHRPRAWLLFGGRGVGKSTLAAAAARAVHGDDWRANCFVFALSKYDTELKARSAAVHFIAACCFCLFRRAAPALVA